MKSSEKSEIQRLPDKYRPLGAWKYFGLNILFSIPIVGWICLIAFACSGSNINRRSYARSFFCALLIGVIVAAIVVVLVLVVFKSAGIGDIFKDFWDKIMELVKGGNAVEA